MNRLLLASFLLLAGCASAPKYSKYVTDSDEMEIYRDGVETGESLFQAHFKMSSLAPGTLTIYQQGLWDGYHAEAK